MAFITGIGADINSDADWAKFQKEMADMGLEDYRVFVQTAYDRQ
jgi:capsid protein